jgi:hypothetical protein
VDRAALERANYGADPNSTSSSSSSARIIIADDHDLVRESMRSLLDREPDLRIIDEAKDGQQTICVIVKNCLDYAS